MVYKSLFAAIVLIAGVVFFIPREGSDAAPAPQEAMAHTGGDAGPWSKNRSAAVRTTVADSGWSGGVTLERQGDGHFYANPVVNSHELHVLVDTGASVVALTGDDARAIGLDWDESDVRPVARGASGDVYGVPVTIERMQLGGLEAQDVPAMIVPEGLDITLLGQSFLGKVGRVEISGDTMTLE